MVASHDGKIVLLQGDVKGVYEDILQLLVLQHSTRDVLWTCCFWVLIGESILFTLAMDKHKVWSSKGSEVLCGFYVLLFYVSKHATVLVQLYLYFEVD